jgi:hypothetical protein
VLNAVENLEMLVQKPIMFFATRIGLPRESKWWLDDMPFGDLLQQRKDPRLALDAARDVLDRTGMGTPER